MGDARLAWAQTATRGRRPAAQAQQAPTAVGLVREREAESIFGEHPCVAIAPLALLLARTVALQCRLARRNRPHRRFGISRWAAPLHRRYPRSTPISDLCVLLLCCVFEKPSAWGASKHGEHQQSSADGNRRRGLRAWRNTVAGSSAALGAAAMASLGKIIKDDRHPEWLVDSIILSAVAYSPDPAAELKLMEQDYGLPSTAKYEFVSDAELQENGFANCKQTLLVVRSLARGHYVVACRGTTDMSDALTDLNFIQRTMTLVPGAAHSGFLDRAKTVPLEYFRRLLIRGERLVLAGHSLGGAVASLLTLRLLEATGKWCHAQVQCYTFGCPFFADYRLAKYINKRYKRHLIHVVSRNDIVPKVMPVAFTIYSMWAGLGVGPLSEVLHLARIAMLVAQLLKVSPRKLPLVVASTQALTWVPWLLRFLLHRGLALALSHQSGYGYAFAGHMVLLDTETNFLEYAETERWKMENHLRFHMNVGSLDVMKEHSLLSYIDHVFAAESHKRAENVELSAQLQCRQDADQPDDAKVEVCTATLNMKWFHRHEKKPNKQILLKREVKETAGQRKTFTTGRLVRQPQERQGEGGERKPRALKSRVACLIFARRMGEVHPKRFALMKRQRGFVRKLGMGFHQFTKFVHRFDALFVVSSAVFGIIQLKRFLFNRP